MKSSGGAPEIVQKTSQQLCQNERWIQEKCKQTAYVQEGRTASKHVQLIGELCAAFLRRFLESPCTKLGTKAFQGLNGVGCQIASESSIPTGRSLPGTPLQQVKLDPELERTGAIEAFACIAPMVAKPHTQTTSSYSTPKKWHGRRCSIWVLIYLEE